LDPESPAILAANLAEYIEASPPVWLKHLIFARKVRVEYEQNGTEAFLPGKVA
jgi:hypothetical protein